MGTMGSWHQFVIQVMIRAGGERRTDRQKELTSREKETVKETEKKTHRHRERTGDSKRESRGGGIHRDREKEWEPRKTDPDRKRERRTDRWTDGAAQQSHKQAQGEQRRDHEANRRCEPRRLLRHHRLSCKTIILL